MASLREVLREQPLVAKAYRSTVTPALWHARRRFGVRDRQVRNAYFASSRPHRLQIGCGINTFDGWLNTDHFPMVPDAVRLDATKRFPFADNSFTHVYSEHMIEHITREQGAHMLRECHRCLEPGGRIRIATPDFAFLVDLYERPDEPRNRAYIDWLIGTATPNAPAADPIYLINNFVRDWHHLFIYDADSLERALSDAGFSHITWHALQESDDPVLQNLANEDRAPEGIVDRETMTVEAVKPS